MSEAKNIAGELKIIHDGDAWHGPSLLKSLAGLTAEQAAARPLPNAHSIWEIVAHIAAWENVVRLRLEGKPLTEPEEGDFPATVEVSEEAWARTLERLNETHEHLLDAIAKLSDAGLDEQTAGKSYSIRLMLRGVIHHHVYHAGQVALLRKALV
jgi:uncharacterized damage-inducible protein DinB